MLIVICYTCLRAAFGSSRDNRQEVQEDQTNKCFICSLESSAFSQRGGFEAHTDNDHNMWQYIYLIAYLKVRTACAGLVPSSRNSLGFVFSRHS